MDNDDRFVGSILTRREALRAATVTGLSILMGGSIASATPQVPQKAVHLVVTPEVEEGPFFVDEALNRSDITQGTTRKSVTEGVPLKLHFLVYSLRGGEAKPLPGVHVDIWHADAAGTYSDEESGGIQSESTKGQKWLRGYQVTDAKGMVEFQTIYPGWYPSRTIHVHVKIRSFDAQSNKTHEFTTQVFFDEELNDVMMAKAPYNDRGQRRRLNKDDGLYASKQADGSMVGSHLKVSVDKDHPSGVMAAHFALAMNMA